MKIASSFKAYRSEFERLTDDLPKREGGISRSEAFAFCALCKVYDIDLAIDSGTGRGISTEYFVRTLKWVITIDTHQHYSDSLRTSTTALYKYNNLLQVVGNSNIIIPKLLKIMKHKRCAVFFDGPKGRQAFKLFQSIDVVFAGFHDATPNTPDYEFFMNQNNIIFHTHDKWYANEYNALNAGDRLKIKDMRNGPGTIFLRRR